MSSGSRKQTTRCPTSPCFPFGRGCWNGPRVLGVERHLASPFLPRTHSPIAQPPEMGLFYWTLEFPDIFPQGAGGRGKWKGFWPNGPEFGSHRPLAVWLREARMSLRSQASPWSVTIRRGQQQTTQASLGGVRAQSRPGQQPSTTYTDETALHGLQTCPPRRPPPPTLPAPLGAWLPKGPPGTGRALPGPPGSTRLCAGLAQ